MTDTTPEAVEPELPAAEGKDENSVSPAKTAPKRAAKTVDPELAAAADRGLARLDAAEAERHVIGGGEYDTILLSSAAYKSPERMRLTVYHLQRRLTDLGFDEAGADKSGRYGDLTRSAVAKFQADRKLENQTGLIDAATFTAIFAGDSNVKAVIDSEPAHVVK